MDREALVIDHLWLEKIIGGLAEIRRIEASAVDGRAEVTLAHAVSLPKVTDGDGGSPGLVQVGRAGHQGAIQRGSARSPYLNPHRECGKLSAHLSF